MKFSVIIPFRDRHHHLEVLVPRLRQYSDLYRMDMEIIVAEQMDDKPLRRGALRNEAARVSSGQVLILHDVDYLPDLNVKYWWNNFDDEVVRPVKTVQFVNMDLSNREETDIPTGYRHFKKSIDDNFFGGVLCITADAFRKINGYNPMFEGWGLEDDEFRERIIQNKLNIRNGDSNFLALPHPDSFKNDDLFRRNQELFQQRKRYIDIGFNITPLNVKFNIEKCKEYDVDQWIEVSNWIIPNQIMINKLSNIYSLSYGNFATLPYLGNDHVQNTIARGEYWEPDIMALCEKYAKPNTNIIDIGANMGTFTVRLAQLAGSGGMVIAFEPQRIIFQQLCCNIFLNNLSNVYAFPLAIGKDDKSVKLTSIDYHNGAPGEVRIVPNGQGEEVLCRSLDSFNLTNISLIKINVERYEPFVFDGARRTIETNRPIILFELTTLPLPDYPSNFVVDLLRNLNYNIYKCSEVGDYLAIPKEKDDN